MSSLAGPAGNAQRVTPKAPFSTAPPLRVPTIMVSGALIFSLFYIFIYYLGNYNIIKSFPHPCPPTKPSHKPLLPLLMVTRKLESQAPHVLTFLSGGRGKASMGHNKDSLGPTALACYRPLGLLFIWFDLED